ncbi:hypothetical protein [Dictyobacter formicarum]|nr:hypothetical protein [Dictyobacter formicarum]
MGTVSRHERPNDERACRGHDQHRAATLRRAVIGGKPRTYKWASAA